MGRSALRRVPTLRPDDHVHQEPLEAGADPDPLALRAFAKSVRRTVTEVEDNGPGLVPEVRERVFVSFFSTNFSTKAGGSGIGRSLSHRIARLHGGTLTVASEPDVRTVFTMRL